MYNAILLVFLCFFVIFVKVENAASETCMCQCRPLSRSLAGLVKIRLTFRLETSRIFSAEFRLTFTANFSAEPNF